MKGQIKRVLAILFAVLFVATLTASAVSADDVAKRTAPAVGDDDVATLTPSTVEKKVSIQEFYNITRGMKLYYRDPIVGPWTDDPDNPCYHVNPYVDYRTDFNRAIQNGNFLESHQ